MESVLVCAQPAPIPVDLTDLLHRCLGRVDLVERILRTFQIALDSDVRLLEAAVLAHDLAETAHLAHRLKGASLAASALELAECAQRLEAAAQARRLDDLPDLMRKLKQESLRFADVRSLILTDCPSVLTPAY